jgi:chromosome segregation ATPase
MINNETTSNVKLTLEQLQQIDAVETKLAELNTQIAVANKNLRVITNDSNRLAKERISAEALLADLTTQNETLKKSVDSLTETHNKTKTEITNLESEMVAKKAVHDKRETDLNDWEAKSLAIQNSLNKESAELNNNKVLHENDKVIFNSKVAKLKEVISTF